VELGGLKKLYKNELARLSKAFVNLVAVMGGSAGQSEAKALVKIFMRAADLAKKPEEIMDLAFKVGWLVGVTVSKWFLASNGYTVAALAVKGLGSIILGASPEKAYANFERDLRRTFETLVGESES